MADNGNPYFKLVQQDTEQTLRSTLQTVADRDPDTEAKFLRLAEKAGVPVDAVRLNPAKIERQLQLQELDYAQLAERYPSTAALLSDPKSAALAKDDVPGVSALEDTLNFGINAWRSVAAAVPATNAGLWGVGQAAFEGAAPLIDPLVGTILPGNPLRAVGSRMGDLRRGQEDVAKRTEGEQEGMGFVQKSALSGFKSLGQNLLAIPASVASGSPAPMLATMTATTGGAAYGQARDAGVSPMGALAFGSSQAMIEYATEKIPAVLLLRDVGLKSSFRRMLTNQVISEVPGEQAATVLQDLNEWAVLNPEKPFSAYLAERPSAAAQTLIATIVATGGQVTVTKAAERAANGGREQQAVDLLTALKTGVTESKTFERAPERMRAFIASHTKDGPLENLFIPAQQLATYFQSVGIDPVAAATEMGATNYMEAFHAGTDVVVPLADFITNVAKTPHYDALLPDIRFRQGDMTARERDLYERNQPEELRALTQDLQANPPLTAPAVEQIVQDMVGQLVGIGQERGTAESYARMYAGVMSNLAQRTGMDPWALHEQYGMTIVRPMPGVLTDLKRTDIDIDPLLDRMRAGDVPTDDQIFGKGLLDFLRESGGVRDDGGELRRLEVDANRAPFMRNLIQAGGRAIDEATAAAREAGYPVDDILAAIEQEITGNPVYANGSLNEQLLALRESVNALGEYLNQLGIDLSAMNNQQVRDAMAEAVGQVYEQETLPDTITVDGVERATRNANGQPIATTKEALTNFWHWFGDSRVVDEQGRPLVVYHGTKSDIEAFEKRAGKRFAFDTYEVTAPGFFFTESKEFAAQFGTPMPVYLRMENPLFDQDGLHGDKNYSKFYKNWHGGNWGDSEPLGAAWEAIEGMGEEWVADMRAAGIDGTYVDEGEGKQSIFVFDPTQIKSVDNTGAFSPNDARILFQTVSRFGDTTLQMTLPISRQSYAVRYALRGEIKRLRTEAWQNEQDGMDPDKADERITGAQLVARITERLGDATMAMEYLKTLGITEFDEAQSGSTPFPELLDGDEDAARLFQGGNDGQLRTDRSGVSADENLLTIGGGTAAPGWSGATRIRRKGGQPAPVYRGAGVELAPEHFDYGSLGAATGHPSSGLGVWFSLDAAQAEQYGEVEEFRLDLRNPKVYTLDTLPAFDAVQDAWRHQQDLIKQGFDGIVVDGRPLGGPVNVVAFNADQVILPGSGVAVEESTTLFQSGKQDGFAQWSHGHPVVSLDDSQAMGFRAGEGVVVEALHGTTADFEAFSRQYSNIESDLGAGFYFTNNRDDVGANYAGTGPDLTAKMERASEMLANQLYDDGGEEWDALSDEEKDAEVARRVAAQFKAHEGMTLPVFVRFDNPVVLGGDAETFLTFEEAYDEDTEEYGEPAGTLVDLFDALREVDADRYGDFDAERVIGDIMEAVTDYGAGGMTAADVIAIMKQSEGMQYATDYQSDDAALASSEIVRQAFAGAGFDGFIDQTVNKKFGSEKRIKNGYGQIIAGKAMDGMDESTVHFIAFEPTQIKSRIGNDGSFDEDDPSILSQGTDDKRGYIQFGRDRKFSIALLEKADLSTFLHETGHFWLEVMGDLAADPAASEQIRADYAAILKFLKVESREQIGVEQHELFARANEAYLREGRAPSPELRGLFQRFKAWLTMIYRTIEQLNVTLTDEVRGVFDRIYASDAEIEAAADEANLSALFLTAAEAGMTEQEFAAYSKSVADVAEQGKDELRAKLMRQFARERTAWWKGELDKVRDEVAAEVAAQLDQNAFATLTSGALPDGTRIKLDKAQLVELYGKTFVQNLPRGKQAVYVTDGTGWSIQDAAAVLGFDTGAALVQALANVRKPAELVEAEAKARMVERHGDMLVDGTLADEAIEALHNEQRANVLRLELTAIRRKQREVAPFVKLERDQARAARRDAKAATDTPPLSAFRDAARGLIGQKRVRDLAPYAYLQAERRAAKEAFAAMASGDHQTAAAAKQRELLNHYLYLEATRAQEDAEAIVDKMRSLGKKRAQERIGRAGADYLDQINAILDQYEFAEVTLREIDRRMALADWISQQQAQGYEPNIPSFLVTASQRVNYKELPVDQLRALRDAAASIEHLATLKNKLLKAADQRAFDEVIAELVEVAEDSNGRVIRPFDKETRTAGEKVADWFATKDRQLLNVRTLVRWLDGGRADGPWHRYLFNPASDAQTAQLDLIKSVGQQVNDLMEDFIKDNAERMIDRFPTAFGTMTRKKIMAIAFNFGTEVNYDKLLRGGPRAGAQWNAAQVNDIVANLDAKDWAFIQGVWDIMESRMYPAISDLTKRISGVPLEKKTARAFTIRTRTGDDVSLAGGYYPIKYSAEHSEAGLKQATTPMAGLMEFGYGPATTPRGHTKSVIEGYAAPMEFDFGLILSSHLAGAIKDLTHREFLIDTQRILKDRRIRTVLQERLGVEYEGEFEAWLKRIANDGNNVPANSLTFIDKFVEGARSNATTVALGFKVTTMLAQFAGFFNALEHPNLGAGWMARGLSEVSRHPQESYALVVEKSGEMRHRFDTIDQTVREVLSKKHESTYGKVKDGVERAAFIGINIMDRMVTIPTWIGAYRKALASGMADADAVHAADDAVVGSQGAGGAKDLSTIQGARGATRLFTMFYTPFAAAYNRARSIGRQAGQEGWKSTPEAVMRLMLITFVPNVMGSLLTARGPSECATDDAACYAKWLAVKMATGFTALMPFVREAGNAAEQYVEGKGGSLRISPLVMMLDKSRDAVVHGFEAGFGDREFDAKLGFDIFEASGYLLGWPTGQARITAENLWQRLNGDDGDRALLTDLAFRRETKR